MTDTAPRPLLSVRRSLGDRFSDLALYALAGVVLAGGLIYLLAPDDLTTEPISTELWGLGGLVAAVGVALGVVLAPPPALEVFEDRLEWSSLGRRRRVPFASLDLERVALPPLDQVLWIDVAHEGREPAARFQRGVYDVDAIDSVLKTSAVPAREAALRAALERGEPLAFREHPGRALRRALTGIVLVPAGLALFALTLATPYSDAERKELRNWHRSQRDSWRTPNLNGRSAVEGCGLLMAVVGGFLVAESRRRRRGGLVLTREGMRSAQAPEGSLVPWSQVTIEPDDAAVRLKGPSGEVALSLDACNGIVCRALTQELCARAKLPPAASPPAP